MAATLPTAASGAQRELAGRLVELGQSHLFEGWAVENVDADADRKLQLLAQLERLDASYPGGIAAYVERARDLLGKSKRGENPFAGYTPGVPACTAFPFSAADEDLAAAEAAGRQAFQRCACVLVAGGLGERLGYSGIKVELPSETTSGTCFLGLYAQYVAALQDEDNRVPFVIMTSDDTHEKTLELLERERYFGLDAAQVTLVKQEKVASLADNSAKLALKADDPYDVLCKPHGHGDVHILLHQSGLTQKWLREGREWVMFFQDTNPMSFRTMPAALGVSAKERYDVNSVAIPRKAKAAAGAIMRLVHEDGQEVTINVEYNYIDNLLKSTGHVEGDVNDPTTGYSPFPGNMNQLIFRLAPYAATLERTGGAIPEFVNPKYADEAREQFKSPTRLECMMQDYPLTLKEDDEARVGVTVFEDAKYEASELGMPCVTHRLYAPAKNNLAEAAPKAAKGIPDASTTSTELAIYACNALMLRSIGCQVADARLTSWGGISQPEWPHIVLLPRFCPLFSRLADRFRDPSQVLISATSALVLDGDVVFDGPVALDGALEIRAGPGVKLEVASVDVNNRGGELEPVEPDDVTVPEPFRIRGFRPAPSAAERLVCVFDSPGAFRVAISNDGAEVLPSA